MSQVRLILPIGILLFLSSAFAQTSVQTVAGTRPICKHLFCIPVKQLSR